VTTGGVVWHLTCWRRRQTQCCVRTWCGDRIDADAPTGARDV